MKSIQTILLSVVIAISAMFLTGCEHENSEDVNQDRIYVYYELLYNGEEDVTYARATFFFGSITGTHLELTAPSQVTADGQFLTWKEVFAYYETSFPGLRDTITFEWQDTEENTFINGVRMHNIGIETPMDTIHAGLNYELTWTGAALSENEKVASYINGPMVDDSDPTIQVFLGSTSVLIGADATLYYTPGNNNIFLRRTFSPAIQEATEAGAEIHAVYRTPTEQVYVATE